MPSPPLTAVVLAGGGGVRMGGDKAVLVWRGERLVDRVLRALAPLSSDLLVARGGRPRLDGVTAPQLPDPVGDAGPVAGVLAGLQAAAHPLVLVLGVDFPSVDPGVVALLSRRAAHQPRGVVAPLVDGRAQPLYAVWHRDDADEVSRLLRRTAVRRAPGVGDVARHLGLEGVADREWRAVATGPGPAWNANRPADLRAPPTARSPHGL